MGKRILVTGATGKVAGPLVGRLVKAGHSVRALVHDVAKADALRQAGAEVVAGEFGVEDTLRAPFAGVDAAFLVVPPHPEAAKWNRALFAAAKTAGAPHIVRLSVIKSAEDGPTDNTKLHGVSDRELRESGLTFTLLRPHFFMQNLLGQAGQIAKDGALYLGMGDGRLGLIDTRDITDSAFAILDAKDARQKHGGKAYDLTGPASITFHDVAAILTKVLDRPIKYVPVPVSAVVQAMKQMGASDWMANVMGQYSKAYSENWADLVTGDVRALTGHAPRSLETFAREVLASAVRSART